MNDNELCFDLAELLAGVTDDNRHDEVDWGAPVGRERDGWGGTS